MNKLRDLTGNDKEQLKVLARVRGSLSAMFWSDLVTADGNFLEQFAVDPDMDHIPRSKYLFPREQPTRKDWELWISYMKAMTVNNYELPTPMGRWIKPTHRQWEWIVNEDSTFLYGKKDNVWKMYANVDGRWIY